MILSYDFILCTGLEKDLRTMQKNWIQLDLIS